MDDLATPSRSSLSDGISCGSRRIPVRIDHRQGIWFQRIAPLGTLDCDRLRSGYAVLQYMIAGDFPFPEGYDLVGNLVLLENCIAAFSDPFQDQA